MKRLLTGIKGLDSVLNGGFPELSTILVAGVPGSGKTIFTQNIMFNINKEYGVNVLYLSTVSEPQIKVIRYQQIFTFFSTDRFMESVIYRDIGSEIKKRGVQPVLEVIDELVKTYQPALIVIDSFKAIGDFLSSPSEFREFISDLNLRLALWECTVFLVGEYFEDELKTSPEAAIADGIIFIYGTEERKMQKRFIRILKMRGTDYLSGEHMLNINSNGIEIFPRLNPNASSNAFSALNEVQATGIHELDLMMGGGIPKGSTTFVTGPTGTGKTLLALKWPLEGLYNQEPVLFISFNEGPEELIQAASNFGWDLEKFRSEKMLNIIHVPPVEFNIDQHVYNMQIMAKENNICRLVIDSISTFEIGMTDKVKFTDYIWGITNFFKQEGVSQMLLNESPELFTIPSVSRYLVSHIADNIIYLKYFQDKLNMRRLIGILKMRGKQHDTEMHELIFTPEGPRVNKNRR